MDAKRGGWQGGRMWRMVECRLRQVDESGRMADDRKWKGVKERVR